MKDIEIGENLGWTIFGSLIIVGFVLAVLTNMITSSVSTQSDAEVQLELAKHGYHPIEISCAYNIEAPACLLITRGDNNDAAHE